MGLPAIAGLRRARWFLKTTAVVVTVSFLGLYLQPLALAARLPSVAAPAVKTPPTHEEKLSRALEDIEDQLRRLETRLNQRADATTEKASLKTLRQELDALDKQARADFDAIERNLKDKKLPQVILDRHAEAVRTYRSEMAVLKSNLDSLEIAKDDTERKARAQKARGHLKAKQKKKAHTPVDPNNLPFRVPDAKKTRKPAKTKQDFRKLGLLQEERIQVAATELMPGMLTAAAALALPTPADLQPTEDVQITSEIEALAATLEHNPVKIYNWVHDNIRYLPTYGSIQGSQMTLMTQQGNAFDTASILIALLRASGIPAHYVYGTIQISADQAMNWVGGVTKPEAAQQLLGQGGIPNTALVSGGKIVAIELEHVWVEAYVDFHPSRGAIHKQGDTWIPLDASFKQYQYHAGIDIGTGVPFDAEGLINQLKESATINEQQGYISNISTGTLASEIASLRSRFDVYLSQIDPAITISQILGYNVVTPRKDSILSAGLPYRLVVKGDKFSALPEAIRHYLEIRLYRDSLSRVLEDPDLNYRISLPQLAGKRFTLSFDPASSIDEATLRSYLNGEVPNGLPAYLIQLRPSLRLSGEVVANGGPIGMGEEEVWDIALVSPNAPAEVKSNTVIAGTYTAIVYKYSALVPQHFQEIKTRIEAAKQKAETGNFSGLTKDDFSGEFLYLAGLGYWAGEDLLSRIGAKMLHVTKYSLQALGLFSWDMQVTYKFGIPYSASAGGLTTDVDFNKVSVVSKDNSDALRMGYMFAAGVVASHWEGSHWQRLIAPSFGDAGVSAVQIIAHANQQGVPIYMLNGSNLTNVLPNLIIDQSVKNEITNAVSSGKIVILPKEKILKDGWYGTGYIILDPQTGSGAYMISGGLNGGGLACECLNLPWWLETLAGLILVGVAEAGFPIFAALAALVLAGVALYDAFCQIDEAPIPQDAKEILKGGILTFFVIGVLTTLAGLGAVLAGVAVPGLLIFGFYLSIIIMIAQAILIPLIVNLIISLSALPRANAGREIKWVRSYWKGAMAC